MLIDLLKRLFGRSPRAAAARPQPASAPLAQAARLYASGAHETLIEHCRAQLATRPDDPDLLQYLATGHLAQGDTAAGIDALRRAASVSSAPGEIHLTLARLLLRQAETSAAIDEYRKSLAHSAGADVACLELAELLNHLGRCDEAEQCTRAALALAAGSHRLQFVLARTLFEQGKVEDAVAQLRMLMAAPDIDASIHSELLRILNYSDATTPQAIFEEHLRWAQRHAGALAATETTFANVRDTGKRLRIAFVSAYFRKHAVTFFIESVLPAFDPAQVEIILYSDVRQEDEYSARLQAMPVRWCRTADLSDEALAQRIRADAIDILFDLTGHAAANRLLAFARRPAPVQMTWNGYPNTTGMRSIDYRVTDAWCDPPGMTEHLHSERLLRLPSLYMSWQPPQDAPAVGSLPARHNGHVTFASFNACYKLTPTTLLLWSRILLRQSDSRLLLVAVPDGCARERIRQAFSGAGVDPARLDFRARVSHESFLGLHADADIALDSFPYHGTTTTCFSLWMGVPVVTLAGRAHLSRVGVTMLTHVGLPELVARDSDDYVRIACDLAADLDRLSAVRARLRACMRSSALADGVRCAGELQAACRQAWVSWCGRPSPDEA